MSDAGPVKKDIEAECLRAELSAIHEEIGHIKQSLSMMEEYMRFLMVNKMLENIEETIENANTLHSSDKANRVIHENLFYNYKEGSEREHTKEGLNQTIAPLVYSRNTYYYSYK